MKRIIVTTLAVVLICTCYVDVFAQRGRRGGQRQRQTPPATRRGRASQEQDADFQKFYQYIPKEQWNRAVAESGRKEKGPKATFEYQKLEYPKGDKNPTSYRFDMGPTEAPVKPGWTRIVKSDQFSWKKGYGWSVDTPENDFAYTGYQETLRKKLHHYAVIQNQGLRRVFEKRNRELNFPPIRDQWGTPDFYDEYLDEVSRDAILDPDHLAFKVALPNGRYLVTLIVGDMQIPRLGMDVYANGYLVASNLFTGKIQFRGYTEPASPWPVRVSFPVDVVRNNMRIALRPNGNLYQERIEVMAETPDYNFSQMPFCFGRLSKFFGKRLNTHGPPTQMALAGVMITPYVNPPLSLYRQTLVVDKSVTDQNALDGVARFNAGDTSAAEELFDRIADEQFRLKSLAYMALAGLLEARPDDEMRCMDKAIAVLEKAIEVDPDDVWAADQLKVARFYRQAVYLVKHASEYALSEVRAQTGVLLNWVSPHDILYSKKLMHYGRAFASIDPHRWTPSWHVAEEALLELEELEPGNRFSGYYLYGKMDGWELADYQSDVGDAPSGQP